MQARPRVVEARGERLRGGAAADATEVIRPGRRWIENRIVGTTSGTSTGPNWDDWGRHDGPDMHVTDWLGRFERLIHTFAFQWALSRFSGLSSPESTPAARPTGGGSRVPCAVQLMRMNRSVDFGVYQTLSRMPPRLS